MKILSIFLFAFLLFSCEQPANKIERFTIYFGNDSIDAKIQDSTITALIPYGVTRDSLLVKFGDSVILINAENTVSMFGYNVTIKSFTGIPIVYINTNNVDIVSKDVYIPGSLIVDGNTLFPYQYQTMQIKGRGNSTWGRPKNPYKIKLDSKLPVMGMPEDKEWALLANYLDKSLIRNDVALELSERLHMTWTPRRRFVEVFLNGKYNGQYLLTETVKSGKDRLPLAKNAWLIEADARKDAVETFQSGGVWFSMKEPETGSAGKAKYVMDSLYTSIGNYKPVNINYDSWIKWGIVEELMRNRDGVMFGSCYFYLDSTGVNAGPVWDFDLSSGAYEGNVPEGWYTSEANFFQGLFLYSKDFRSRYKQIWNEYREQIKSLPDYVDSLSAVLELSRTENFRRWDNINTVDYDGQITGGDHDMRLSDFIRARFTFMDSEIQKF